MSSGTPPTRFLSRGSRISTDEAFLLNKFVFNKVSTGKVHDSIVHALSQRHSLEHPEVQGFCRAYLSQFILDHFKRKDGMLIF